MDKFNLYFIAIINFKINKKLKCIRKLLISFIALFCFVFIFNLSYSNKERLDFIKKITY